MTKQPHSTTRAAGEGPLERLVGRLRAALAPEPPEAQRELLRLMVRAGRRCAHDLAHAADELALPLAQRKDAAQAWHERAQMWTRIFYPASGPKDYRDELHHEIWRLGQEVERLRSLCRERGIDPDDGGAPPF